VQSLLKSNHLPLLISLLFLGSFLFLALFRNSFEIVDGNVNFWAASIQTDAFTGVAKGISIAFDTTALLVFSLVVAAVLFMKHYRRDSVLLLGAMAGDAVIVAVFKTVLMSPRPWNELIPETGYSFPSGHVTGCVVFFGLLTYFVWTHCASIKVKTATGGLYVAITALVGFDRVYLNVHWFSDVVGGCLIGVFWLAFSIWIFQYLMSNPRFQRISRF
jgi:membrane-associated phospholipid phosphatase